MSTTLYKTDANDKIRVWSIIAEDAVLIIQHGVLNGATQVSAERVSLNKSGRDIDQQVALAMQSRINKQRDKGYCDSIEEAIDSKGLNASKLAKPMLAQKFRDVKSIDFANCFVQYKYNGHRCLVTKHHGLLIAYSRNGKPINSIAHILKDLQWLPEGYTLDGELYLHGAPLQAISSLVRKNQPASAKLVYVVYDLVTPNVNYSQRNGWLRAYAAPGVKSTSSICLAPTYSFAESKMPIKERLAESIANGYEGLILRHGNTGYEPGKRSQSLVKVKQVLDDEFCIVGVHQSADGWAIFECNSMPRVGPAAKAFSTFKVSAMGTIQDKHAAWTNRNDFIGKMLTVEFFEWTIDNKPFHPVAIGIRGAE
jgi:DNA ligase-1